MLGADLDHPTAIVDITAPVSGVITDQNVTAAAGVKTLDNSPNLFTISDLSHVWILCDVYENDLAHVQLGESAEIRLNCLSDRVLKGASATSVRFSIRTIRTAKVRLEVHESRDAASRHVRHRHLPRPEQEMHAVVPASAILASA